VRRPVGVLPKRQYGGGMVDRVCIAGTGDLCTVRFLLPLLCVERPAPVSGGQTKFIKVPCFSCRLSELNVHFSSHLSF
jgi:hypothetical protein